MSVGWATHESPAWGATVTGLPAPPAPIQPAHTNTHTCPNPYAHRPQDSTSAIVTLASSGIARPAQLDGKTYASYGARFEGRIVQQLIRNDGGKGDFLESTPPMLGIWETLLKVGRGRGPGM